VRRSRAQAPFFDIRIGRTEKGLDRPHRTQIDDEIKAYRTGRREEKNAKESEAQVRIVLDTNVLCPLFSIRSESRLVFLERSSRRGNDLDRQCNFEGIHEVLHLPNFDFPRHGITGSA